ncbi:unnamed protein product [Macrosiphum euphorbiae]|uniref:Uncharacterized protein n=1 Tax=Macrosiphum euphorbiae TaxID=13131 RepID=A0AAV0WTN6_9HEMI|nr:unnamed protein product [Macrosiphum euphorbiae]
MSTVEITLEGRNHVTSPAFGRCSSMPNMAVQTAPADDAFDVGLPSAADDSEPIGSVKPSSGSAQIVVDNSCASLKFLCYISLVNMSRMSSRWRRRPSLCRPTHRRQAHRRSSFGLPKRKLNSSQAAISRIRKGGVAMPNIAVLFSLADIEDVPSRETIDTSEFGRKIVDDDGTRR